ncbi:unnamed protein product [Eretmochelys imbricata]
MGAFIRSCNCVLQEMDHSSQLFYALEKKRGAKKHVTFLSAEDGTTLMDLEEMQKRARAFYISLSFLDPANAYACREFWDRLLTVNVGDQDQLELPLTRASAWHSSPLSLMPVPFPA